MRPKNPNTEAWKTKLSEAIEKYSKDSRHWGGSMLGGSDCDHSEAGVRTKMKITATSESVDHLNYLIQFCLNVKGTKIAAGDTLDLAYKVNLSLDDFIPTKKPQIIYLLQYLRQHPNTLEMDEQSKEALLGHLEKSLKQAENWHSVVKQVMDTLVRVFIKQEIAKKKANNNKVIIE